MAHSEQTKTKALELLSNPDNSYPMVRDATGVPVGTLAGWAKQAGIERANTKGTDAATSVRQARIAKKRAKISEEFLDAARSFVQQARRAAETKLEVKDGIFVVADGRTAASLMTAAGIAIDKMRLEMGEHTSHEKRSGDTSAADEVKSKIDELSQRREKKTA